MYSSFSRRRFLYMGAALAGSGALATRTPLLADASHPADSVTITFWTPGGSARWCGSLDTNARQFEKLHPHIRISKIQCGTGQQDFLTVLLARIAAGNPPDATIYWDTPVTLAARGALQPLDDLMAHSQSSKKSDWPVSALASCVWNGKTWGLPATAGSYAVWYNADWFARKGIPTRRESFPKTFDELRKLSKEFTFWKNGTLVSAGFIPVLTFDLTATFYIWSALNGGQLYDAANKKYTIDSEQNIQLMEYMVSWLNEEYRGDASLVTRSANWAGYADAKGRAPAFQGGQLAMLEQGFWFMGDIYSSPPKFSRYNVASYPVGPGGHKTVSGYWPNWFVIPQGSQHAQQAFQWLDYLGSTGIRLWFSITPDLPTNKTVPYLLPAVTVQKEGKTFAADVTRFFHHQLDIAIPMWNSPVQGQANDELRKAADRIMNKVAKPKDALADAQRACQAALDKALHSS